MEAMRLPRLNADWARASAAGWLLTAAAVLAPSVALGAELHLREGLLQAQRDRVTATITATVDHLGPEAHPLDASTTISSDDCDLHVPLRSRDIRVPFIGEVKNACSQKPSGAPASYWSDQL